MKVLGSFIFAVATGVHIGLFIGALCSHVGPAPIPVFFLTAGFSFFGLVSLLGTNK